MLEWCIKGLIVSTLRCATCMPCAGDCRALIKRWVSHGAKSPISTCLFWSLWGTGSTLQSGSLLMYFVSSRKVGRSPERSRWTFLDTLSCRTWKKTHHSTFFLLLRRLIWQLSYLIHLLIKSTDQLMQEEEGVCSEKFGILCFKAWGWKRQLHADRILRVRMMKNGFYQGWYHRMVTIPGTWEISEKL